MRASYSLNKITEIHETECTEDNDEQEARLMGSERVGGNDADITESEITINSEREGPQPRSRRQFTPQLSSESEGEPPPGNDILTRYLLDSIGRSESSKGNRSKETEDSLNSSDSEYNTEEDRRRNKVNLRQLEERLNMIQEECHWSDSESDDERSATIDDRSERNEPMDILDDSEITDCKNNNGELPSDDDLDLLDNDLKPQEFESVFSKIDQFLDNSKLVRRRNSGRSRSEGVVNILFHSTNG